ncbi:hypothetical protein EON83_24355 [bacterium]|nr:MAG: hypothetical protein EON83_24355 [bacterium]
MKSTVAFPFAVSARTLAVLVLGASLGGLPRVAHSQTTQPQPEAPVAPNTADPADADNTPTGPAQVPQGTLALNPQQLNATNRQQQPRPNPAERPMRDMMTRNGITTTTTQDAILAFLNDEEDGKRNVRDAARRLLSGVRRGVPTERMRTLLTDYQKALESERLNRERAQRMLDARVGYSLDARLESMLWLLGVLGDGQNILTFTQQGPQNRNPRMVGGNGMGGNVLGGNGMGGAAIGGNGVQFGVFGVTTAQLQIEGVVNAKNAPQEAMVWLEIRDGNGRLWRMVPSDNPNAQPILNRQITGLVVGTHVLVRLVSPQVATPNALYSLLALAPATNLGDDAGEGGEQGGGGAPYGP